MMPPKDYADDTSTFRDWAGDVFCGIGVIAMIIALLLSPWIIDAVQGALS